MSARMSPRKQPAVPKVKADLMGLMIGTLVGDVVQMRLLGVDWKDSRLALKALALDRVFKCIEHEEAENDQTIDANWISGYGKVLRVVSTANGGLHQQFVNQYVEKGTLPPDDASNAIESLVESLTPIWTLFEMTREVAPTIASLMVGGTSLLAEDTKRASVSRTLAIDYVRWQITGKIPSGLKAHPAFKQA